MPTLTSHIDTESARFKSNCLDTATALESIQAIYRDLPGKSNRLSVRARVAALMDSQQSFLEFSRLAAHEVYPEAVPAAGILTGLGRVEGRDVVVIANDPAVKGGIYYPLTVKKHLRALEVALQCQLPVVYLVDSGGANLQRQDEVFPDKEHFGRIFFLQAQLSALAVPQIAVVLGPCTAGGAYIPAMADIAIMVRHQSRLYLAGPPLVKAAIGEEVDEETLGGADTHCRISGVADYLAKNDEDAIEIAKQCLASYPAAKTSNQCDATLPPRFASNELNGIATENFRQASDSHEIITRIIDDSDFDEFKALYGKTLICGFARIGGERVGIIANNGVLFSEAALKGSHFIQLCDQRRVPLLFLQNITGFMVGKRAEAEGIAKHGAKMVMAVATATVPKVTIITGGSFGAGNYAMCGRAYSPDFLFCWPTAKVAVMGGEQAAGVFRHLKRASQETEAITQRYQEQSDALYGSARLWDDGIIPPSETRDVLIRCFSILASRPEQSRRHGIFRM
ncbi:acyl-CoA carboxylase subunit beta [Thaumasiovibrio subtropicus]|uniref:acyl-CoA carboxylase subunit beta n=1 Tax=Thaumasiovibrio subtropicus TaxID=1891207 RepID=UPI000B34CCC3|nr:carboxyl transferase domain-containing protein [Thaumasiovibrio subtropicus]